jgi:hypothetical protein
MTGVADRSRLDALLERYRPAAIITKPFEIEVIRTACEPPRNTGPPDATS